ncbi:hypothetical protein GGTG_03383 [Gaeumannomyces tritici R3-111a-1]|uniref:Glutamine amidotransferase domain-containing protein n=1 Tax=Gaeumannomyces tritici (strain R3-111a-1) TaxID=644352 RepID=J3NQ25_GAET3|nr:hypothetical protein GGTG_03383 [Gaeumannomyces tritici R3-111a-1]EJT78281.1 hypothetical protein GGTG_03383 [Gaeumannomyces tritici R3-111a-1]
MVLVPNGTPGPTPVVRMMVLETDEPHPKSKGRRGTYGEILRRHFESAGADHDPPLGVQTDTRFVVTDKGGKVPTYDELNDFHAVLITGSMYDAHGSNEWITQLVGLLTDVWRRRPDMRFSGVCFGHQILNRILGSTVAPAPSQDWELGHCRINLTATGQRLFQTNQPFVHLHQMHQDQVVEAPDPAASGGLLEARARVSVWGSSRHTKVQGTYIPRRVFTTQAHLAFDERMVKREMEMRVKQGAIEDPEHVHRAAETAHLEHDGDLVAAAILRFFHGDDDEIDA